MASRESTALRGLLLVLALTLGWSASGEAAGHRCAGLAAVYIDAFSRASMEILDADDVIPNPCTGARELAVIDFKPGYGFIATFASGDVHGEVDNFVATLCEDGRAMLKDSVKSMLICDTR